LKELIDIAQVAYSDGLADHVLGHLILVCRDLSSDDAEDLPLIFDDVPGELELNAIRLKIRQMFKSYCAFAVPPASYDTRKFKDENFTYLQAEPEFQDSFQKLRKLIYELLPSNNTANRIIQGLPVTFALLDQITETMVKNVNDPSMQQAFPENGASELEKVIIETVYDRSVAELSDICAKKFLIPNIYFDPADCYHRLEEEMDPVLKRLEFQMSFYSQAITFPKRDKFGEILIEKRDEVLERNNRYVNNNLNRIKQESLNFFQQTFSAHWEGFWNLNTVHYKAKFNLVVLPSFVNQRNASLEYFRNGIVDARLNRDWICVDLILRDLEGMINVERNRIEQLFKRLHKESLEKAVENASNELERRYLKLVYGEVQRVEENRSKISGEVKTIANHGLGNYLTEMKFTKVLEFLNDIPTTASVDELIAEFISAVENHEGAYLPVPCPIQPPPEDHVTTYYRQRTTKFNDQRRLALEHGLKLPSYLNADCPNPGNHADITWCFSGYNMRKILALAWNAIRRHREKDELTRRLIEDIWYGLCGNVDLNTRRVGIDLNPFCPNGQASTVLVSLNEKIDIPNAQVLHEFLHDEFAERVFHAGLETSEARNKAAETFLDEVGIVGEHNPKRIVWLNNLKVWEKDQLEEMEKFTDLN
jgi:tetrahydromethanopterin S-methyltransferase subunit G